MESKYMKNWYHKFLSMFESPKQEVPHRAEMVELLIDCRKRARDYAESDPYMAGLNQGRAEILEAVLNTVLKDGE